MKEKTIECPRCTGTGNILKASYRAPDGTIIEEVTIVCPQCNGSVVILIPIHE